LQYLKLGNTDLTVSEVGFGCIPIVRLSTGEAVRLLCYAYERGINFFDTANAYQDSEQKIGLAFQGYRDKVVLATKSLQRNADGLTKHLENSLRMLKTDYLDLFQFHMVSKQSELEAITAPGGALEAAIKAKEQGKIRYIGITTHSYDMAIKLMKTGYFKTMMFPFNFIEDKAKGEMLQLSREKEIGFLAMKPFGGGALDNAELCFKFLRQFPDAIPVPGFDSIKYVDEVLTFYEQPNIITEEDLLKIQKYRNDLGSQFCRRCGYCQPCPNGVIITSAMSYPLIVKRMSPAISVKFSQKAMDSVPNCTKCGSCVSRCPYELPIPNLLQKNYELYTRNINLYGE
jgi:predicted aldo/keto reductase-like oxidoreductase